MQRHPARGASLNWSLGTGVAALSLMLLAAAQPAAAQSTFANPPSLPQTAPATGSANVPGLPRAPSAISLATAPAAHAGKERAFDLHIQYTDGALYDPGEQRYQRVHLRSYVGTGVSPGTPYVAPEINVTPGDTVRVTLHNDLPPDPSCSDHSIPVDQPHCNNGTNLHSHGLWVSPTGNSDNVLISLNPGVSFQYEYNIPADHPAGTFWYHPHRHGSTALQVASGMAGALVIHGDRKPTPQVNGDLDTLLVGPDGKAFKDRTVLFQQIQYYCLDDKGQQTWNCKANQTGIIENIDNFGPGSWQQSGRWTSINGVIMPTFTDAQAGTVERWRLIHAGIRETINVEFHKMVDTTAATARPTKDSMGNFIDTVCTGPAVPYQVVAADGLTMGNTLTNTNTVLQPGYRYDVLVVFPQAGNYCVTQKAQTASNTVSRSDTLRSLLGVVTVRGGTPTANPTQTLVNTLVASAQRTMPADVRAQIIADLTAKDGMKLSRFVPHPTITDDEVKGVPEEDMVFYLGPGVPDDPNKQPYTGLTATKFTVANNFEMVQYDGQNWVPKGTAPYNPAQIDRKLVLGTAQQWELRSYSISHPFHIHVNPFQIVAIYNDKGRDVSLPGAVDDDGDTQFAGLKGAWKDTLWVKTNDSAFAPPGFKPNPNPPIHYYRLIVRTRYERYIGEFVLHCHILDHEDQGMMQNVEIGISDGAGGLAHAHH
ncbi:FtsP/CotA-like multicopper oxidase with cupredoxin domain [Nitrospirillum amazonense]|uniref:FtsP/CotA-like multicopper oxidase with cupredoxin domain n=1 Tax=Nitrospirillum amazonense TaxID=28077 RepID=A0A560FFU7_9PROT|nr:multicopper oxidase domain-containing protein [Nitrospirillum amazonense]TWB20476.1 FtsP/CotA-like multicopper oxidase with cupredoxin domain [Nitrospirillum amazonense]